MSELFNKIGRGHQNSRIKLNHYTLLTGDLDLASDLSKLLLWDFYPALLATDEPDNVMALAAMAELNQQRADRSYLLFRSTISKLQQFLLAVS
jgi:hypothetical protein